MVRREATEMATLTRNQVLAQVSISLRPGAQQYQESLKFAEMLDCLLSLQVEYPEARGVGAAEISGKHLMCRLLRNGRGHTPNILQQAIKFLQLRVSVDLTGIRDLDFQG